MKLRRVIIPVLAIVLFGYLIYNKVRSSSEILQKNTEAGATRKNPANMVSVYIVAPGKLDNRVFSSGTVLANNEVQLYSEISGKITHIYFKEGGKVSKGQLLLKINDADLQAQLAKAKAISDIDAEIDGRNKQLLEKQGISQQEYDQGHSAVQQAKADVDFLKAQIAKTEIRSPYNGVIGLKNVSEGSFLSPTIKIATIQEIEPVKIDFSIPEKYMNMVKNGDQVKFTIAGATDTFIAEIYATEPKIDLATRSLLVRAVCPNRGDRVLPGSFAQVELILKQTNNALMIPTQAIIPILKGEQVFLKKNGKALAVNVETGIRNDSSIQIIKGLKEGDTVITTGILMLRPGSGVEVKNVER